MDATLQVGVARRLLLLAAGAVISIYVHLASGDAADHRERWETITSFNSLQARSFLNGHTFLAVDVPRRLLALPDPYDPLQNSDVRLGDALLYQGKYYMYWGPVPALLLAPIQLACGKQEIGDQFLVLAFTIGSFAFGSILLVWTSRRLHLAVPRWAVVAGVMAYGLSNPMPFLLSRPAVYEAAIAGGQCFLIGALLLAALADASLFQRRQRITALLWLSSGVFLAAAVGCRLSLAPAVAVLAIIACSRILHSSIQARSHGQAYSLAHGTRVQACLLLPLFAGAAGLALFNKARFGSFSDVGIEYQLAGVNVHAIYKTWLTSIHYAPANAYSYLLRPVEFSSRPPFAAARVGLDPASFPSFVPISPRYMGDEPVAGALLINPLLWCLLFPIGGLLRRSRSVAPIASAAPGWLRLSLLCVGVLAILPALGFIGSTMRYLADGIPALTLLGTMQAWRWIAGREGVTVSRPRRFGRIAFAGVCAYTAFMGVALADSGYKERKAMVIAVDGAPPPAHGPADSISLASAGDPLTLTVRCGEDGDLLLDADWLPDNGPTGVPRWSIVGPRGTSVPMPRGMRHDMVTVPAIKGDQTIRFVPIAPAGNSARPVGLRVDRLTLDMVP